MAEIPGQYTDAESARNLVQMVLNGIPWDSSGPIDSMDNTTQYLITTYGVNTGLSAQEIAAMVSDAYHYNGVPETGYKPKEGTDPATGGTGTTGTGTSTTFDYNGVTYNTADPNSMNQYNIVRSNELATANADLDSQYQRTFEEGNQKYEDQANQFNQNLDKYNKGQDDYSKQLYDLYEGFGQGNVRRQNYFTRLAPDTYQSGQGSSADYANTQYQKGYGETSTARNEYGANLNQGLERLGQNYNNFVTDNQKALASAKTANNRTYNDASYGTFGNTANFNGFTPVADVQANQVDLSKYTPYTNFQGLQGSAGANMFKKFAPTQGQDPLSQTLGYTPPTAQKDPRNAYLYN